MAMHRNEAPGENGGDPVPRDMQDQLSGAGDDHWDVDPREADPGTDDSGQEGQETESTGSSHDVPDTDEAGTGREGAAHGATVHPEHPTPDESSG
ncbi:hypothetical protein [Streptomyces flavalbus]|uniref:Uncharacterized protein n=1 Tax=Streptomyces flavalbus TaxID=2665155 RepID=A0ABW2WH78_9ACTN